MMPASYFCFFTGALCGAVRWFVTTPMRIGSQIAALLFFMASYVLAKLESHQGVNNGL